MNILQIYNIWEVSIGSLNYIYEIYQQQGDKFVHDRMLDFAYLSFVETLWDEPRLSLKSLIKYLWNSTPNSSLYKAKYLSLKTELTHISKVNIWLSII